MAVNKKMIGLAVAGVVALPWVAQAAVTGWDKAGGGSHDYNDTANWVGGVINGVWDSSLTLTAAQNVTFSTSTVLTTGLSFNYDGSFNPTFLGTTSGLTLTLGGDILVNTVSTTRTVNFGSGTASSALAVDLGGQVRTFTVGSGRSLGFVNAVSNGGVIVNGGTVNFSGVNTYSGTTTVNTGLLSINNAGSIANSDVTVNASSGSTSIAFATGSGSGATRAKSVTLNGAGNSNGATLTTSGHAGANVVNTITNGLTGSAGQGIVTMSPNASRNLQLAAGSFSRNAGSTILFRGTNLGVNSIASATAGSANLVFASAPALVGGSGAAGTSTLPILQGAYGDIASAASGAAGGLLTYDSTNGLRVLNASTEYAATITNGQTALDNVRYVRASGGASQDLNLTAATTTINSLSFSITGAGTNSGVTISGDTGTTLKLNSGAIFASQSVTTAAATDAMTISVPTLDLNGQEGVFITFTNGVSNGNTNAPLRITSAIANDGGKGVTLGGSGQTIFSGSAASTYTGPTTINSGILRLDKSVANIGLTGDLIMNGGSLLKSSNAIADTANVTINGGAFWMDSTFSSGNNGHQETVNNFTMNGGGFGNHGTGATLTVNGNFTLNGTALAMNQGGDVIVAGTTTLNGGLLTAKESTSASVANGLTTLGAVTITSPASGAYTPITLVSHATNKGALLTLNGDLTFVGNGTNANSARIDTSDGALANQGVIALNGTRTFNVGNGAAAADLVVVPAIVNGSSTGGLAKTGTGTLLLTGTSTYSGPTDVNAGTLIVNGSLGATTVTVAGNATLSGSGTIGGSVTVNAGGNLSPGNSPGVISTGDLTLASSSNYVPELNGVTAGTQYDQTNVTGGVTIDGNLVATLGYAPTLGDKLFIINNDGADAVLGGGFANLGLGNTISLTYQASSYQFTVSYAGDFGTSSTTGGNDVVLVAVPEPAAVSLLGLGIAGLLVRRRKVG